MYLFIGFYCLNLGLSWSTKLVVLPTELYRIHQISNEQRSVFSTASKATNSGARHLRCQHECLGCQQVCLARTLVPGTQEC